MFDEDEWYMLSEIARVYKIHDALDWYDENGNISLEKMQNNVIFEYDGSKYRAAVLRRLGYGFFKVHKIESALL